MRRSLTAGALLTLSVLMAVPRVAAAQAAPPAPSAIDETMEAGEAEVERPARKLVKWNEYEGRLFTIRLGGEVMFEYADFAQDDNSRQQFDLAPEAKVRDARFLLKGRLKFKRPVTWTAGFMYDGPSDTFLVRETGIMVAVPEILGHIFVGRTKEGFSLNKVMSGAAGWTMERAPISDATLPILADGIKWLGYAPKAHLLWNLGFYVDWLSEGQSFSTTSTRCWAASRGCPSWKTPGAHFSISASAGVSARSRTARSRCAHARRRFRRRTSSTPAISPPPRRG